MFHGEAVSWLKQLLFITTIIISGCGTDSSSPQEPENDPPEPEGFVDVTFLGNHGVMLDDGENKVMIDGMHNGGDSVGLWSAISPAQCVLLQAADAPFDNIDVTMVTHNLSDHYNVGIIGHYLFNSPETQMLAPSGVRDSIATFGDYASISDQVVMTVNPAVNGRSQATINGLSIDVLNMQHFNENCTDCGRNYAYMLTLGELKILHLGDADMLDSDNINNFDLAAEDIDILFLATPYPEFVTAAQRDVLNSWINPGQIVAMHLNIAQQSDIISNISNVYPEATILTTPMSVIRFEAKDFVN